ncbi:hypothetical protein ABZ511_01300 [Nocardia gamkensis]|uniref:hypothetical protein n=1 Tax=Nocardia gamkensis TaxID=352869 RepID=UPI0034104B4D
MSAVRTKRATASMRSEEPLPPTCTTVMMTAVQTASSAMAVSRGSRSAAMSPDY